MSVVVVGGGIVGASIAWHLAHGTKVTVIAEAIGGVATPKSFAWVNAASPGEDYYYDFRNRSIYHWMEMGEALPELPIHWGGSLSIDRNASELAGYQEKHQDWGTDMIRINQTQMSDMEPEIKDIIFPEWDWGLYSRNEGAIEAHEAARQLIAHAESLGATVIRDTATGFVKDQTGRVSGVSTKSTEVNGDHVVLAAGLGSVPLLAAENINLPLSGRQGLLVNTAPVSKKYLNSLVLSEGLHMRQTLDNRIRFGPDFTGGESDDNPRATAMALFERMRGAFNNGEELKFGYYTLGTRPDPEDGYPILGDTGLGGLDVAVMHSGVTNAALVGQLLATKVLYNVSDPILDHFRLDRFNTTTTDA